MTTDDELIAAVRVLCESFGWQSDGHMMTIEDVQFCTPVKGPSFLWYAAHVADAAATELANRDCHIINEDDTEIGCVAFSWAGGSCGTNYDPIEPGARARATILAAAEAVQAMNDS